ncbi:hypothetical protein GWK47_051331 [Chionoecetes opilio]|uniref:Tesmin/TSO1-like CXC domain-containing protein n=1 Tax=Chionoecetes opilio TaxID=41210 RepID=A0A8J5CCH0_CHIOP|nr:hypothetical protein GWK47_051331 [Chionoecetes opilio]
MICIFKHSQIWDLRGMYQQTSSIAFRPSRVSCTPGTRKIVGANSLRYHMFCAKKGQIESGQLPPCEDSLMQHTLRANYQAAIWRRSLENLPDVPAPSAGHGWELDDGGSLKIRWMAGLPAPDVVLNLISCTCRRTCRPSDCSCILNGLKCTVVCKLQGCSNMVQDDAIVAQDANDSDGDSDD